MLVLSPTCQVLVVVRRVTDNNSTAACCRGPGAASQPGPAPGGQAEGRGQAAGPRPGRRAAG